MAGIKTSETAEVPQEAAAGNKKSTVWLYISLTVGVVALTLWLGLLTFSAFSDSIYPHQKSSSSESSIFSPVLFMMFLTAWPYECWRRILGREPNTTPVNVKRHKRVTVTLGALFAVVLCVAITFGIQIGYDGITTDQIKEATKDFQAVAMKIGNIKGRELKTTKDYVDAYGEIEPLLNDFDGRFRKFTGIVKDAQEREKHRGPLNIQRLYPNHDKQISWDMQAFDLLHQDIEITRKQVLVTKQMAVLPDQDQVEFWNNNFLPLAKQEDDLRQKLAALQKDNPLKKNQ